MRAERTALPHIATAITDRPGAEVVRALVHETIALAR